MTLWSRCWATVLGVGAALALPPVLLFRRALFGGEALFGRDITPFFYPMKQFMVEAARGGTLPLWNPGILNGEPFFATLQPGLLYPASWLLFLGSLPDAIDWLTFLHYPLAGAGIYLLLRRWDGGRAGAALGAVAFTVGGYLASVGNFTNNLQTVAWLPWLFLTWHRYLESGDRRDGLWFALTCAVAFLAGEPQMLALGVGFAVLHGLLRVEAHDMSLRRQTVALSAAGILAVGLVAVQLLPFVELLGHSVRTLESDLGYSASRTLTLQGLTQLLVPPALEAGTFGFTGRYLLSPGFSWLVSVFPGTIVLAFGVLGAASPRSRRWGAFWLGACLFGVVMALGPHTPVFPFLHEALPPLRMVRYPEKFFFLTAVGIAVLSARGLDRWLAGKGRRLLSVVLAVLAAVPAALALGPGLGVSPLAAACESLLAGTQACSELPVAEELYLSIGIRTLLLLGALGLVAGASRRLSRPVLAVVVVTLAAMELVTANQSVNPTVESDFYLRGSWVERVLPERGDIRGLDAGYRYRATPLSAGMGKMVQVNGTWELSNLYLYYQAAGPNLGQVRGVLLHDGLQGVELTSVARMFNAGVRLRGEEAGNVLRAMNVRYYGDPTPIADSLGHLRLVASHPELPIRIWEVEDPVPRAYLVDRYVVEPDADSAFQRILQPGFPLHDSVVLDAPPSADPAPGAAGRVLSAQYGLNRVELEVSVDGSMLLVLADRHYPGWNASVDGRPTPIQEANGHFRAVAVPRGRHRVVFEYRPVSFRVGGWISGASVLLLGMGFIAGPRGVSGKPSAPRDEGEGPGMNQLSRLLGAIR